MTSIIEESRKARRNGFLGLFRKKKIFIAIVILAAAVLAGYYFYSQSEPAETAVQIKEWTVSRGDIKVAIESEGKVVAKDGVELSFSVNEDSLEVDEVYVKEGQAVKKGDKIASVKTNTLELSLRSAYASYQSALASYNEKIAGATGEEMAKAKASIEQAELSLEQSKITLEKLKTSTADSIIQAEKAVADALEDYNKNRSLEASEDLSDVYEDLLDQLKVISIPLNGLLDDSDAIIGVDDKSLNDDFESNLGATDPTTLVRAAGSYETAKIASQDLEAVLLPLSKSSPYDAIESAANKAETALAAFEAHLYDMQEMLNHSITDPDLTQSELDAFKSGIASSRSSINTKISSLSTARKTVTTTSEGIDDYEDDYIDALKDLDKTKSDAAQDIVNAEANIRNRELSLEQAKLAYDELVAPLTDSELASARSSLTSASVSLARARNELDKATIISPIDGEVAQLNYAAGDIIVDSSTAKPAATVINKNTLYIEVNIEEAEINKLKNGQSAIATFDALEGVELSGEISFISLTSQTDNNGIVTYLVRVVFENTPESEIREGMTAFVDFVTGGASDVLMAPVDAVRNVNNKPSVQLASGEWAPVTTGFTDGKTVEIISGIKEGDKIIY